MFEANALSSGRRKKQASKRSSTRLTRPQALKKLVDELILNIDRYNFWWVGPPENDVFKPAAWGKAHNDSSNAIFTAAFIQGINDRSTCTPVNCLKLFLGSLRRAFDGDVVVAIEHSAITPEVKAVLINSRAVVYEISQDLCSQQSKYIFCGSPEERVPASVFRYFFFEKWAALYSSQSLLALVDFRDIFFQSDPFAYNLGNWYPDHQLAVFQEFYPNMVINRCRFNKQILYECYGEDTLRSIGHRVIVSSGGVLGSRDAVLAWAHHMTMQLQEAPGRIVETRCLSGGIEHSFINYLIYGNKLRSVMRIKIYAQGDGPVNSLGGLNPDTVSANITGSLRSLHLLDERGAVLNWNGDASPVVHQIDHFVEELMAIANGAVPFTFASSEHKQRVVTAIKLAGDNAATKKDAVWQILAATQCLWGCP